MKINKANFLMGTVNLPGDKSISHRAAMMAAMAEGVTVIDNYAASKDCGSTLNCLSGLGVVIERNGSSVTVNGRGKNGFSKPADILDCGNSGTTMRLLSGILAGQDFESILDGDNSLRSRPMRRITAPLGGMGAVIDTNDGNAPLRITGRNPLNAVEYVPPAASAQIKSCVLFAGLNANGITTVTEKIPTRDHTERMLRWFGADITEGSAADGKRIGISGDSVLTAKNFTVPADVSAAAFFIVAAACLPNSNILLETVGLNPSRRSAIDVIMSIGSDVRLKNLREISNEPVGDIVVSGGLPNDVGQALVLEGDIIANLIDEIPILAILGTQLAGGLEVRGAGELRVKESDRITAVVENLRRMNGAVEEFPDGFRVKRSNLTAAKVDSFDDHRIAMAFAVAGLLADGETEIAGAECVEISFPGFFDELRRVVN